MAGPIDARVNPTQVDDLATSKPIEWFERNLAPRCRGAIPAPRTWLLDSEQRKSTTTATCSGVTNSCDGCFSPSNDVFPASIETPAAAARCSI